MSAARFVLDALRQEGIEHVFMVPGGLLDPFLTELGEVSGVEAVVAAHEAGAAFMADGYARASGLFGVCLGIGGPGVANMVGPLAAAYADESPVLAITGQVATNWEGRGAFQDASPGGLNDLALLTPITAYAEEVPTAQAVAHSLHVALRTMLGLERRPVCLSLPKQVQGEEVHETYRPLTGDVASAPRLLDAEACAAVAERLAGAGTIAVLAGNGAEQSEATDDLVAFAEAFDIPVASTLRAKGVFPEDHPLSLGVFGYSGTRHATEALMSGRVDVLLVLGSSLNQRDTMVWSDHLRPRDAIVQVDLDPSAFGRNYDVDVTVVSDVREVVRALLADDDLGAALEGSRADRTAWIAEIRALDRHYDADTRTSDAEPMHPARVVTELRRAAPRDTVMLIDSGAHRAFTGHHWDSYGPREYLSSTTLAPMGWAIAAAVGAKVARPDQPCAVVTGDGCMLMHGMEIQTAAAHGLAIVFVVVNNGALGNVYLRARKLSPSAGALARLPVHDWVGFARSLGADGVLVEHPGDLAGAFEAAFAAAGPFLLDIRCDPEAGTPITPWSESSQEWILAH
ncbi:MAG: acetolactate synthase large subunit [Solirubrobacteraceae bacterium]|nr:acetolactate synthase large subunit [Solirubrobacteraceae bacterium]